MLYLFTNNIAEVNWASFENDVFVIVCPVQCMALDRI